MSTFAKVAIAAVVVIAVGTVGIIALRPSAVPARRIRPDAIALDLTPFPVVLAARRGASMPPPLSETFTSPTNGISISYPAGWSDASQPRSHGRPVGPPSTDRPATSSTTRC